VNGSFSPVAQENESLQGHLKHERMRFREMEELVSRAREGQARAVMAENAQRQHADTLQQHLVEVSSSVGGRDRDAQSVRSSVSSSGGNRSGGELMIGGEGGLSRAAAATPDVDVVEVESRARTHSRSAVAGMDSFVGASSASVTSTNTDALKQRFMELEEMVEQATAKGRHESDHSNSSSESN
jgi:hypothetical protein